MIGKFYAGQAAKEWVQSLKNLDTLIADDLAAGKVQAVPSGEVTIDQVQNNIREAIGTAAE